jgi:uncharacterized membrane protein
MNESRTGDRLVALFLFGCLALSPPLLAIFSAETVVASIPLLFFYLFTVWAILIVLLALIIERRRRKDRMLAPGADED